MKRNVLLDLRDSLRRRGFWVELVDHELVLDQWYSRHNFLELVTLLTAHQIPIKIGDRGLQLESNIALSDGTLRAIETSLRIILRVRLMFLERTDLIDKLYSSKPNDLSILELDRGIAPLVFAFNKLHLYTAMSCDGHGSESPKIWFNDIGMLKTVYSLISKARMNVSLAYDWETRRERRGFILTARKRISREPWIVSKIQDDAFTLSNFLLKEYKRSKKAMVS